MMEPPYVTAWLLLYAALTCAGAAISSPPTNLTLSEIWSDTVQVSWEANVSDTITSFDVTIRPMSDSPPIVQAHLDGMSRSYVVDSLDPETEYELVIKAHHSDSSSTDSDVITFRTLSLREAENGQYPGIDPAELIIVCLILIAWFCSIALFVHKWGKLRILETEQPRYNHRPKNIESIKVVQRSSDSIIHKSYSSEVTRTMAARQKHLERMNTMPNIKLRPGHPRTSRDKCTTNRVIGPTRIIDPTSSSLCTTSRIIGSTDKTISTTNSRVIGETDVETDTTNNLLGTTELKIGPTDKVIGPTDRIIGQTDGVIDQTSKVFGAIHVDSDVKQKCKSKPRLVTSPLLEVEKPMVLLNTFGGVEELQATSHTTELDTTADAKHSMA